LTFAALSGARAGLSEEVHMTMTGAEQPAKPKRKYRPRRLRRLRYAIPGLAFPRDLDCRTAEARTFKARCRAYADEVGGNLTDADLKLVARAAAVGMYLDRIDADIIQGRDVNSDTVIRLSSEHRRLLERIGVKAEKTKPSGGPTLADFLAQRAARAEDEDTGDVASEVAAL
jgi:hypothetical protein